MSVQQREPKPGQVGAFLVAARRTGKLPATCQGIVVDAQGRVRLAGGARVTVRHREESIDHYAGGGVRRFVAYHFTAPGCAGQGRTTIEQVIGRP